ncbi:tRNA (guanine(26)-N(2))-dimethyltransferase-like [Mizuhopecten yessoensis]|uniref:tRNA (guanine(26)-N(2))-dimethyltransferase-like n=1 Tax=Mizuhopecten yessoensis TaxID=6573 RepID=UPI000B458591|nr:tRNA (guanine(26)-N(2))-dimethyltransferase-like [Mizuhopecten yessoensis]XP_021362311.1 tRNA (guanine(26)-N(2))-dimethyltransferase-like [Mizuhopecten yessoensis]
MMLFRSMSRLCKSFAWRRIKFHTNSKGNSKRKDLDVDVQYKIVNEGKADVLLPAGVFYNPVQEFNRDLTLAIISIFAQIRRQEIKNDLLKDKKNKYNKKVPVSSGEVNINDVEKPQKKICVDDIEAGKKCADGISILDSLAASGLRSIRYGLEIPGVKKIVANDFDKTAVEAIQKNIERNKLDHLVTSSFGDASMVMYMSKGTDAAFDVIDLDPYGGASQFLDAAVQSVSEGGLLCVTCTDMALLCGRTPESCRARYGTMSYRSSYCKEMALRILLQSMETTANRYSRYIIPMISISADFYIRVFVRVFTGAANVRLSSLKLANMYHCSGCGAFTVQRLARKLPTKGNELQLSTAHGPPVTDLCEHCEHKHYVAGPVWADRLHDTDFVKRVIKYVQGKQADFQTRKRIIGMLSLVSEELQDCPMYYVINDVCKKAHVSQVKSELFRSALLNAGFEVSMSHAEQNSIKTNASNTDIWDIVRSWERMNPVHEKRRVPGSVTANILSKKPVLKVSFKRHQMATQESKKKNLLRYQQNPAKYWGPMSKPKANRSAEPMLDRTIYLQGKRMKNREDGEEDAKMQE